MSHEAASSLEIDLLEFERLREEIDNRTSLSNNLIVAELAALGAGAGLAQNLPGVLLCLAAVSSFLWLMWMDHTTQIYKIAAYIGRRLAPKLSVGDRSVLEWEHFLRLLDQGGVAAAQALYGDPANENVRVTQTRNVGRYISLLFGSITVTLILLYFFFSELSPVLATALIPTVLLGYAVVSYLQFKNTISTIDQALLAPPSELHPLEALPPKPNQRELNKPRKPA